MSTKLRVLELLKKNSGTYFSGEELAGRLEISRTAVWKAVKQLRAEGFEINAATNKGYMIGEKSDILTLSGIRDHLDSSLDIPEIRILDKVDSTNNYLKQQSVTGNERKGLVVISNEQTAGRGRFGRSFYSPVGSGIYMSMLLRPHECSIQKSVKFTTMAAAAVCEALEETGIQPKIKWVNDIFVGGRKVCGILTEGSADLESGFLDHAVLGIGVNLYEPENGFPEEIKNIAGGIFKRRKTDMKNKIASGILNRFYALCQNEGSYTDKYRERSMVIGKMVDITHGGMTERVQVKDIDSECALVAEYKNGEIKRFSSGEISIIMEEQ